MLASYVEVPYFNPILPGTRKLLEMSQEERRSYLNWYEKTRFGVQILGPRYINSDTGRIALQTFSDMCKMIDELGGIKLLKFVIAYHDRRAAK